MRDDVRDVLPHLQPREAKLLAKGDYQRCFAALRDDEHVRAAVPVIMARAKGVLVVTDAELLFVSRGGDRVATPLSDVHGARFHMSRFSGRGYQLYVQIGPDELTFGSQSGRETTVTWFVAVLDEARGSSG
jgi:hypothetical protein